jgi:hypothetical protein
MRTLTVLAAVAACQAPAELPWLHGLDNVVMSTSVIAPRAPAEQPEGCSSGATRTIELISDVAPAPGRETVVASYRDGIAVFDNEDHLLAETPGYPCEGSADELDIVAFGTAYGRPLLVVAATSGGRRETSTWLALFRTGRTLEPLFTGVVETRVDGVTTRGAIHLVPAGLVHVRPGGRAAFWRLDPGSQLYIPVLPETPHDEPALSLR